MSKRIGKRTIRFEHTIGIRSAAAVTGKKESEGPLSTYFDQTFTDDTLGEATWEKAESRLQTTAASIALQKTGLDSHSVDVILAGDLLNQCISSTFGLRSLEIPFLGQYGACSTMAQTLLVGSILTDACAADRVMAVTSSHFCSAERQFRLPIEYGGQRNLTAQWTVTGAGAAILERDYPTCIITEGTIGKIVDMEIKDACNMGAAMAPAAADTIAAYFQDTGSCPSDFDLILTGDLGHIGSELLIELLQKQNYVIADRHDDCGKKIFYREEQDVHAGGSGCGCCASVFCSEIWQKLCAGELTNILFIATGALMSPTSSMQGESIPSIAHLLHIRHQ